MADKESCFSSKANIFVQKFVRIYSEQEFQGLIKVKVGLTMLMVTSKYVEHICYFCSAANLIFKRIEITCSPLL